MTSAGVENQIAGFLGKYSPDVAAQARSCRAKLRALFPRGHELVFDNYNALVFAFAASTRASDALLSLAVYPRWVTLFFLNGTTLADPEFLLQGTGKQVRSIRLASPEQIDSLPVRRLITQAVAPIDAALLSAPPLATTLKSVSARQRPRQPGAAK